MARLTVTLTYVAVAQEEIPNDLTPAQLVQKIDELSSTIAQNQAEFDSTNVEMLIGGEQILIDPETGIDVNDVQRDD